MDKITPFCYRLSFKAPPQPAARSRYLGTSERFRLNLQARYALEVEKDRLQQRDELTHREPGVADQPMEEPRPENIVLKEQPGRRKTLL